MKRVMTEMYKSERYLLKSELFLIRYLWIVYDLLKFVYG